MSRQQLLALERALTARAPYGRTCVPIIGSGVNIQAALQDGAKNTNDWDGLLRRVSREVGIGAAEARRLPPTPLAKWESLLRRWSSHNDVEPFRAERDLQAFVCSELRVQEQRSAHYSLYGEFLAAGFADIISLNFDRQIALHQNSEKFVAPRRRDMLYRHSIARATRVWYPHGDTRKAATLRLGVRKYGMLIGSLERERTRVMAIHRRGEERRALQRTSAERLTFARERGLAPWLELILLGAPLVFIGCSLAADEWPLWWLLHQRARNCGANAETYMLSARGSTAPHLSGSPSGVTVIEFATHEDLWRLVRRALNQ